MNLHCNNCQTLENNEQSLFPDKEETFYKENSGRILLWLDQTIVCS